MFVLSELAVQRAGPTAIVSFLLAGAMVLPFALSFAVITALAQPGNFGMPTSGRLGPSVGQRGPEPPMCGVSRERWFITD